MKLLGHPVHIWLIHFPTALLPFGFALSLASYLCANVTLELCAFYSFCGGVAVGLIAACFGFIDLLKIPATKKPAQNLAWIHGALNVTAVGAIIVLVAREWRVYPNLPQPAVGNLIIEGIAVALILVSNFLGGELLLKHHIGISNLANER